MRNTLFLIVFFFSYPLWASKALLNNGEILLPPPKKSLRYSSPYPTAKRVSDTAATSTISLYLSTLKDEPDNPWALSQLAATFSQKGLLDLAEKYLQLSSQQGFWYYYNLLENKSFNNIRETETFRKVLIETKQRYHVKAEGLEGKSSFYIPSSIMPSGGWPVVFFLHDAGKSANITHAEKHYYNSRGIVYVELNGTQMLSENTFRWSPHRVDDTHRAIQRALDNIRTRTSVNNEHIYLLGRTQGAMHAANVLARYPESYAGGVLISPAGVMKPETTTHAKGLRIFISYFDKYEVYGKKNAHLFYHLFKEKNNVKIQNYSDRANTLVDWLARYSQPIMWVNNRTNSAKPEPRITSPRSHADEIEGEQSER